jgi:hypothetical protein
MLLLPTKIYAQKPKLGGNILLLIWKEWFNTIQVDFPGGTVNPLLGRVDSFFALGLSRGAQIFSFTLNILPFAFNLLQILLHFLGRVLGGTFRLLLPTNTKFIFKNYSMLTVQNMHSSSIISSTYSKPLELLHCRPNGQQRPQKSRKI